MEYFLLGMTGRILSTIIVDGIRSHGERAKYDRMLQDRELQYERQILDRMMEEYRRELTKTFEQKFSEYKSLMDLTVQLGEGEVYLFTKHRELSEIPMIQKDLLCRP